MTLATLLKLRELGESLPAAAVALSPWADLAGTGATYAPGAVDDPLVEGAELDGMGEEYAPNAVKKVVVGVGHADKQQVEHMVRMQLPSANPTGPDAADALAIALCHAHHARFAGKLGAAIEAATEVRA